MKTKNRVRRKDTTAQQFAQARRNGATVAESPAKANGEQQPQSRAGEGNEPLPAIFQLHSAIEAAVAFNKLTNLALAGLCAEDGAPDGVNFDPRGEIGELMRLVNDTLYNAVDALEEEATQGALRQVSDNRVKGGAQ